MGTTEPMGPHDQLTLNVVGLYKRKGALKPNKDGNIVPGSISKIQQKDIMKRKRVVSPSSSIEFRRQYGDADSRYYHYYKHNEHEIVKGRDLLLQSLDHYCQLQEAGSTRKYFSERGTTSETRTSTTSASHNMHSYQQAILDNPSFGEQLIFSGGNADTISLGDRFVDVNGTLEIEISSPRLCCSHVDKKNGSPFGGKGVKAYCNSRGLGGIFARIVVDGRIAEGTKLVRVHHPHPKWTMRKLSSSVYGDDRPKRYLLMNWAYWNSSKEELEELVNLGPGLLAGDEWKDELDYILEHWDEYVGEGIVTKQAVVEGDDDVKVEGGGVFGSWYLGSVIGPVLSGIFLSSLFQLALASNG